MKTRLLLTLSIFYAVSGIAQFGNQQIISNDAGSPIRVIPYDINVDGFLDVIYTNRGNISRIVWKENLDGQGNFGNEQFLSDNIPAIEDIQLYDFDNDGDSDILYKTTPGLLAWIENIDGQGNFSAEKIIADTYYPYSMLSADMDNDGDYDIITIVHSSSIENSIIFYKNLDGLGTFDTGSIVYTNIDSFDDFAIFDYNNDNFQDIIIANNNGPAQLIIFKNLGGTFDDPLQIFQFTYVASGWTSINNITPADINNDGKIDLLIDTIYDEITEEKNIFWLENLNQQGSFSTPILIDHEFTNSKSLRTYDLDNDSDLDILAAIYEHNQNESSKIVWYENLNGLGSFGEQKLISNEVYRANDATSGDINNDGFLDVVSASSFDDKIAWYENMALGISENGVDDYQIYPNPTDGIIYINSKEAISKVSIFNLLGQKMESEQNTNQINFSKLMPGTYLLKIEDGNGNSTTKKILKE